MIGQTISHYRITEKLGGGGMGVVYKAVDTKLDRPVALKFLPPELTLDADAKRRFVHEAKAASALQHNNICAIHEIDETEDGRMFICMDCYEGETLKEKIARGPLEINEAVEIAAQVAEGLGEAHKAGMVHRDIKPANIVVTQNGVVKILDFGLAKLTGQTKVTKTGTTVGTVAYMSPEQATGKDIDHRSDIFSLGSVLYEMLTGELPFKGDHEAAVLYGITNNEPEPLATSRPDLPEQIQPIVNRCLAKEPNDRFGTVSELLQDLSLWRSQRPAGARVSGGSRRGTGLRNVVGASILILVIAVIAFIVGKQRTSAPSGDDLSLAIVDFRDLTSADDLTLSASMTELVNIGLVENCPIRVVSPEYLRDLRRRLFGSSRGPIEDDQVIEVARKAGATLLLAGRIGDAGDDQFVTWRLVDTRSGESLGGRKVEGDRLTLLADQIVMEVLPLVANVCRVEVTGSPTSVDRITTESDQAYRHFVAGLLSYDQNRGFQAREELERAVAIDSMFALGHLELAGLYWGPIAELRSADKASYHLERARTLQSRLGIKDRLRLEATDFDQGRQLAKAVTTYGQILERWPDDREALADLASLLSRYWDSRNAAAVAKKGLEFYPDDLSFGSIYTNMLLLLGQPEDAMGITQDYVKRYPREPNVWADLAACFIALGLPDSAEAAIHKRLELDPLSPISGVTLPVCVYSAGDLGRAISLAEQYLTRNDLPPSARHWRMTVQSVDLGLAALYGEAGRHEKMIEVVDEARQYSSAGAGSGWAHARGSVLLYTGRAREAFELAHHMVGQYGDVRAPFYALRIRAQAAVALGDLEAARAAIDEIYAAQHQYGAMARAVALKIEAEIALAENRPAEALEALDELEQQGIPSLGLFHITYLEARACAHRMSGRLEDAAAVHNELLRIYGGHALSHYDLGLIYEEMGRHHDAAKEYARFLKMWSDADEGLPQVEDAKKRLSVLHTGS